MISNIIRNFNMKEKEEDKVKPYLEFRSSTPMTVTPNYTNTGVTLQYSLDKVTWNNISAKGATPSAKVIYFRGSATGTKSLFAANSSSNRWEFTNSTNLEAIGNINKLIQDVLGGNKEDIPLAINCYNSMFYGCTSLTTAPALPATKLADYCYRSMFQNCTSLTTTPELPATTLANYCYDSMFFNCTSLVTAPALPATTLAPSCYYNMFYNCSSLVTAPALPATTLAPSCYGYMFYNCSSLVTAPALPATKLASNCYGGMFRLCRSLVTAPALPATTLATNCYAYMFNGCTKIKLSTTKTGSYQTAYRVPTVGTGVDATSAFTDMFTSTGGTFKGTPTINTTYYIENQVI